MHVTNTSDPSKVTQRSANTLMGSPWFQRTRLVDSQKHCSDPRPKTKSSQR